MPTAVFSFKRLANGAVMFHGFLGPTKAAAEADLRAHAAGCPDFGPAFRANETIEFAREVSYLPEFDGDELEEWLDGLIGDADDVADDVIDVVPDPEDEE